MLNANIIAIGRLHEPWKTLAAEYEKRLKPYARVRVFEVRETKFSSAGERTRVLAKEAEEILSSIPEGSVCFALVETGDEMDSRGFASFLSKYEDAGRPLTFVIGGALGLDKKVIEKVFKTVSLSRLTFTHETARVILLEQIYRAATILKGKTYHY